MRVVRDIMGAVTNTQTRLRTPEPGPLTKEIAGIIKGRMARYSVTQSEMAAQVGVDQSQLSKMIRGMRAINLDQLEIMCHVLGVEVHDVVEEADVTVTNLGLWPSVTVLVEEGVRVISGVQDEPDTMSAAEEKKLRPEDHALAAKRGARK